MTWWAGYRPAGSITSVKYNGHSAPGRKVRVYWVSLVTSTLWVESQVWKLVAPESLSHVILFVSSQSAFVTGVPSSHFSPSTYWNVTASWLSFSGLLPSYLTVSPAT